MQVNVNDGLLIKLLRKEKKITLKKMSKEVFLSISKLSEFENGKIYLHHSVIKNIYLSLNVMPEKLKTNFLLDGLFMDKYFLDFIDNILYSEEIKKKLEDVEKIKEDLKNYIEYPYYYLIIACYNFIYNNTSSEGNHYYSMTNSILDYFNTLEKNIFKVLFAFTMINENKYEECIEYLKNLSINDSERILIQLTNYLFINCYIALGNYQLSQYYLNLEIKETKKVNDYKKYSLLLLLQSTGLFLIKDFDKAIQINFENLLLAINLRGNIDVYPIFINLGKTYFFKEDYIRTIAFFDYALMQKKDSIYIDKAPYFFIAYAYYLLHNYTLSKEYLNRSKKFDSFNKLYKTFDYLIEWLESMMSKPNSLKCKKLLIKASGQQIVTEDQKVVYNLLAKYFFQNKET